MHVGVVRVDVDGDAAGTVDAADYVSNASDLGMASKDNFVLVDTATPLTTNLTFVAGDVISVTGGGASTATATFNATVEYTF